MSDQITLISSDGLSFTTSSKFSQLSGFVSRIIQEYSNEDIVLNKIPSSLLSQILLYSEHHNFTLPSPEQKPIKSADLRLNLADPWDSEFMAKYSEPELIDLISAADYLDMKSLLEVCFITVATRFKDKKVEDLMSSYEITQPLTPEIEDQLKKEFPWSLQVVNDDEDS